MDKAAPPKSVLEAILDWSEQRPAWQRDALRRIVAAGRPDDDTIAEIVALCKKGRGAEGIEPEPIPFARKHLPANPGDGAAIRLIAIKDVIGVNQLAEGQELAFEPDGLTVVYGQNGAGKSGYARILKRACRARHAGEIMPDAFNPGPAGKATATISIRTAGGVQDPLTWIDTGEPVPVLSAICVFDKDCASVHVREKNEVAFRPFGLDIPDDLAGVCQRVKEQLTAEQRNLEAQAHPVFGEPSWKPHTAVGQLMGNLTATSDLKALERLGEVAEVERARHARLTEDLIKDPVAAAAQQRLFADGVRQLSAGVQAAGASFSNEALHGLKFKADDARAKRESAALAAEEAFGGLPIPGVGAEAWRGLWEAARHYAEHTAYPDRPFPPKQDEVCVLCQQPLDATTRAKMASFEAFIRKDTEAKADAAKRAYDSARGAFVANQVKIGAVAQTRRRIAIENPALAGKVIRFLASARMRRKKCLAALESADAMTLPHFVDSPITELTAFEENLRAYARQLDNAADVEGRKLLQVELDELTDRIAVARLLPVARAEISRLKVSKLVSDCLSETATNAITRLGNDIADNVITPKMRDQFQSEIVRLAADKVRVEVVRSGGQFGSPQYQVRFFANPKAKVHDVLSEGEQTCVALAAFLTELATASHDSALVFDDPVSSLDHRWRNKVAERLVAETERRQIVVFTHDLIFVNDLCDLAVHAGAKVKVVTLSRGPAGAGLVADGLPWRGSGIPDRIDKLEKAARKGRDLYERNDEEGYRNAALPIYAELRATWERALEDVVFGGVIHRHRDYIDTKHLRKVTVLAEADCATFKGGFKKCCDLIEAHDPSRGRDADVPPPDEILQDIQMLKGWVDSLRDRQKAL
jgi:energy-coupling factor transporter ATP-binding protein EcfA2